jgi:hypothetical protein
LIFAHKLCLKLGIDDPEQWLEDVPERVISNWEEYDRIDPFGQEWHQTASTNQMLYGLLEYHYRTHKVKLKRAAFHHFMPQQYRSVKPKKQKRQNLLDSLKSFAAKVTGVKV